MNYGNVDAASAAMGANDVRTLRAFRETERFAKAGRADVRKRRAMPKLPGKLPSAKADPAPHGQP